MSAAVKLTHVAKRDRRCHKCGSTIAAGSQYLQRRERALSSHEASHEGLYPVRHICPACAPLSSIDGLPNNGSTHRE